MISNLADAPRPRRRPATLDVAVLIAATAAGLAWARATMDAMYRALRWAPPFPYSRTMWDTGASCLFVAWTLALLALRLAPPRPPSRRLVRQPGTIACAAAVAALALQGAWDLKPILLDPPRGAAFIWTVQSILSPYTIAFAVAGSWLALAIAGRWRPEPSLIDRAGRFVAACWMIAAFGNIAIYRALEWIFGPPQTVF